VGDAVLLPLDPTAGPLVAFASGPLVVLAAAGLLVAFAAVANVPNSMPSIDIDPSSTPGSDIERLWALVTTPRTEARRMMTFIIVV